MPICSLYKMYEFPLFFTLSSHERVEGGNNVQFNSIFLVDRLQMGFKAWLVRLTAPLSSNLLVPTQRDKMPYSWRIYAECAP